ncbi:hypothetical protein C8K38_1282 [Rhodococcus sp. OK611]|uniref:hypothetical protein n=1 Tax=Rhodococcus TaxID=1827 RepID=UPI000BD6B751|nr:MULTISPECIES: hypothetical protein [Rhodococcus]MCZ4556777.1 hypothetical protein [Rhodococcus maanshanensis]PTR35811.1 hypothetical protein C8K38_1282 [Rhodococcus sp. OK611]SNX94155.1 hypothetical protein SAMN05447004_1292 [Rhodococcus sp. OK270]
MSSNTVRRIAALAAAAALPAGLLMAGVGTGVANAADPACSQTSHDTKSDWSTVWITHTYDKSVSAAEAAAGTNVTYKIVVGTSSIGNPYVNTIRDYAPAGFGKPLSAKVTSYHFAQGQQTADVTPEPTGDGGWQVTSTGWFVSSSYQVTAEFTYKVPDNIAAGTKVTSGGIGVSGTVGVGTDKPGLTSCFAVRAKNPGEAVLGSADGAGLGSSQGQMSSTGSISDVLGDTITRVLKNGS